MTSGSGPATAPKTYRCGSLVYSVRGLAALFAWMLWGDFCFSVMESVVPSILPLKLHHAGSSATLMGLIMTTVPGVLNFTVTPWLSFKSDRHRSRWGRRLPFILGTMPFLVVALALMGLSGDVAGWVQAHFIPGNAAAKAKVTISLLVLFAVAFDFFNMFVTTVYWYLFNDVVPQELMGRFFGWFRVVGTLASAGYQIFVFKYAESHSREIFICASLVYFVGFGLMCLWVKEGEYPPPVDQGEHAGLMQQIRLYAKESFTIRYYWDTYLMYSFSCIGGCINVFGIFATLSMGLNLGQSGLVTGLNMVLGAIVIGVSGIFVDRWHTVRASAYFAAFDVFGAFGGWVWLLVMKPPVLFYMWSGVIFNMIFRSPVKAISDTAGYTRLMAIFPKEQYGQFSGAMAMVRAVAIVIGGFTAGMFIDALKPFFPAGLMNPDGTPVNPTSGYYVYRLCFLWLGVFNVIAFYFNYRVYRAWKRLGGAKDYVPPLANFRLKDLKPHPGDDGKVLHGPIWLTVWCTVGGVATGIAWIVYYIRWEPDVRNQIIFVISLVTGFALYLAFLRFIKFMERP